MVEAQNKKIGKAYSNAFTIVLSPDGKLIDIEVIRRSTWPEFDKVSRNALLNVRYPRPPASLISQDKKYVRIPWHFDLFPTDMKFLGV